MKIAVSDFDGTLFFHQNDTIPQINIEAVKKWRSVGNIFCICTGRDMRSLMYEMNRHRMEYDFIICNNGGTLFDKNLNIVKSFPLDRQMLLKLVHSDIAADSWHIMYSAVDKMRTTINSNKSQLLKYFNSVKYKNQEISLDELKEFQFDPENYRLETHRQIEVINMNREAIKDENHGYF